MIRVVIETTTIGIANQNIKQCTNKCVDLNVNALVMVHTGILDYVNALIFELSTNLFVHINFVEPRHFLNLVHSIRSRLSVSSRELIMSHNFQGTIDCSWLY